MYKRTLFLIILPFFDVSSNFIYYLLITIKSNKKYIVASPRSHNNGILASTFSIKENEAISPTETNNWNEM